MSSIPIGLPYQMLQELGRSSIPCYIVDSTSTLIIQRNGGLKFTEVNIPLRKDVIRSKLLTIGSLYGFGDNAAKQTFESYLSEGLALRPEGAHYRLVTEHAPARPIVALSFSGLNGRVRFTLETPDGTYRGTRHQVTELLNGYRGAKVNFDKNLRQGDIHHFRKVINR